MLADLDGIIQEKVNKTNWRVYLLEEMFNWVNTLNNEVEQEDNDCCFDEIFKVAVYEN